MKLHLPKPLRNSVLACIAAVAGIATPTLGTATFAGGVVAFTLASHQAGAETISGAQTWSSDSTVGEAVTVDGADASLTISGGKHDVSGMLELKSGASTSMSGGELNINQLHLHNSGGATSETFTLTGGTINISYEDNGVEDPGATGNAAIVIGHWHKGRATLTVENGTLNAVNGTVRLGWDSTGVLNVSGGEVNVKGITYRADNDDSRHTYLTGGRLNLGTVGVVGGNYGDIATFNMTGGTIGALSADGWTLDATRVKTNVGTVTVDTTVAGGTEAANITWLGTLNAAEGGINITLAGSGSLTLDRKLDGKVLLAENSTAKLRVENFMGFDYSVDGAAYGDTGASGLNPTFQIVGAESTVTGVLVGDSTEAVALENGAFTMAGMFLVDDNVTYDDVVASADRILITENGKLTYELGSADVKLNEFLADEPLESKGIVQVNTTGAVTLSGNLTVNNTLIVNGAASFAGNQNEVSGTGTLIFMGVNDAAMAGDRKLNANLTIGEGTTFKFNGGDVVNYYGSLTIKVLAGGFMNMNGNRQSLSSSNVIELEGGTIYGTGGAHSGNTYGLDFYNGGTIKVTENSLIATNVGSHDHAGTITANIAAGKSLVIGSHTLGETTHDGALVGSTAWSVTGGGTLDIQNDSAIKKLSVAAGSTFSVSDGATVTINEACDSEAVKGDIVVGKDSKFVLGATNSNDFLHYSGQADIYVNGGTFDFGANRATIQGGNTLYLNNGTVTGIGRTDKNAETEEITQYHGALDIFGSGVQIISEGTSAISATIRLQNNLTMAVNSGELTYSGRMLEFENWSTNVSAHKLIKTGDGVLKFTSPSAVISGGLDITGGGVVIAPGVDSEGATVNSNITIGGTSNLSGTITVQDGGKLTLAAGAVINIVDTSGMTKVGSYTDVNGTKGENGFFAGSAVAIAGSFTKAGTLTVQLGGVDTNAYTLNSTGLTIATSSSDVYYVNSGKVTASDAIAAVEGFAHYHVASGATLELDSATDSAAIAATTGTGIMQIQSGTSVTVADTNVTTQFTGNIVVESGAHLLMGSENNNDHKDNRNVTFSGGITLNGGRLVFQGLTLNVPKLTSTDDASILHFHDMHGDNRMASISVMDLQSDLTVSAAWKYALNVGCLTGDSDLVLNGNSNCTVGITSFKNYTGSIYLKDAAALTITDSTWTGNVVCDKAARDNDIIANLERFNNIGSAKLTLSGVAGYLKTLNQNVSLTKDIQLINPTDGYAVVICNGNGNQTASIDGAVSGTGDFVFNPNQYAAWNWENVTYNFSGDLSQWSGNIIDANTQTGGTKNLTIKFSGNATDIGVSVVNNNAVDEAHGIAAANTGDNLKLIIANDKAVTLKGKIDVDSLEINNSAVTKFTNTVTTTNLTLAATSGLSLGANASLSVANANGITIGAGQSFATEGAATMDSALTFNGGSLSLGGALNLGDNALALSATNKTALTLADGMVGENVTMVNLFTHVTDVLGITGITTGVKLDSVFDVDSSLADLYLKYSATEKVLVLTSIISETREWTQKDGVNAGTWAEGYAFGATGATDAPVFAENDYAVFGSLVADHTVTIGAPLDTAQGTAARVDAGSLTVNAGVGKKYTFTGGEIHTPLLTITSGTAEFTANTLQLSELGEESISIAKDGVLDLSAYEVSIFQQMYTKATGEGAIVLNEGQVMLTGDLSIDINTQISGDELRLNANNAGQNAVVTLNKALSYTDATNSFLRLESGAKLLVADNGVLEVSKVELGHLDAGGNVGHLEIATGGTVTAGSVAITTGSGGGTLVVNGGTLELTGADGIAAGISTTITAGTLVAKEASWGITGATIGGATVTDGTLSCAVQIQTAGLDTESADDDTSITLTNATLTGTLDNAAGKLVLAGVTNITSDGYKKVETPTAYKYGENGYATTDTYYQLVTTAGNLDTVSDATFTVDGSKTAISLVTDAESDWYNWVKKAGTEYGTVYYVRDGAVTYNSADDQFATATKLLVNGGSLTLETSLAGTVSENIRVETPLLEGGSYAATLTIGKDATLGLNQLSVMTGVKLAGTGVYDIASEKALRNGVQLDAAWEGTVKLTGSDFDGINLDALGNAASSKDSVEFCGVTGHLSQDGTYSTNLILTNGADDAPAWSIDNGWGGDVRTFTGTISGTGDIQRTAGTGGSQTFTFEGDISQWSGMVKNYTTKQDTKFNITGSTEIKASFDSYGSDNVRYNLQLAIDDATIAESVTDKTVVVTGSVNVSSLTLGLAGDTEATRATVKLNNSVTADTLNNYAATTVNGTLAAGAAVTNNGTLELTQDAATLASLAGTGTVTAESLTLTGAATGSNGITADSLTLQAATNTVGALTLDTLTLGANVTSLTAGEMNISGDVVVSKVAANFLTSTGLATGSKLNLNINEDLLQDYMSAANATSVQLATVTGLKLELVTLNKETTGWSATDHTLTTSDDQYTYALDVDANGVLTLTRATNGIIWNGDAGEKWVMDETTVGWKTKGENPDDLAYGTVAQSTIFNGGGAKEVVVSGAVTTTNVTFDVTGADIYGYTFTDDADTADADSLTIEKNLSINGGELKIQVSTNVGGRTEVGQNGKLTLAMPSTDQNPYMEIGTGLINHGAVTVSEGTVVYVGDPTDMDPDYSSYITNNGEMTVEGMLGVVGAMTNAEQASLTVGQKGMVTAASMSNAGTMSSEGTIQTQTLENAETGVLEFTSGEAYIGANPTATNLSNAGAITVSGASVAVTGGVDNDGDLYVTGGSLNTGDVDNSGSIAVTGGTLATGDVTNDGTLSVAGGSMTVTGDLDNTDGDITLGSADATGSLSVTGNLTHAGDGDIVVNSGSSLDVAGDLAADGMTLDFDGTVTVGGNAKVADLTINEGASFTANQAEIGSLANNGTLSVGKVDAEGKLIGGKLGIGELTGSGAVNVGMDGELNIGIMDGSGSVTVGNNGKLNITTLNGTGNVAVGEGGTLYIKNDATFTGTVDNKGTVATDNKLTLTQQTSAGGTVTAADLVVTQAANGSSFTAVTTGSITIESLATDGSVHLTTGALAGKAGGSVALVLSQLTTAEGMADIIATGEHTYNLLSIGGTAPGLTMAELDADLEQQLWKSGLKLGELESATTMALRASSTNVSISVLVQSEDDATWNVGKTATEIGLTVIDANGKLLSNDILDNVQKVVVSGTQSIDMTGDITKATINKLAGTSTSKLTIAGDGKAADTVTIGESTYNGTLVLDGVAADFDLTGATVVGADKDTTLSGKLTNGTLSVQQSSTAQGAGLVLTNSTVQVVIDKDFDTLSNTKLSALEGSIARLGEVTAKEGCTVAVGTSTNGAFTASAGYDKYFDMSSARVEGGKVVADRNTVYYTSKLADSSSTDNGKAGLAMADEALLNANPQGATSTGDLAAVLDQLDTMVATGNKAAADELGASLAGASTAVLGMAAMGDVDRQLRAIRNRTTTMGVDQSVVNADMPYFNAWINAEGDSREMGEDGTLGGYKLNSYGGTVGFDVDIEPTLTAGMALTAMYGDLDATGADKATGNLDSYYVSAFARYCGSAWTHTFVGTIGMGDISLDRTVGSAQVKGETDSMSFGLMYEVGRVYAMDEDGTTCLQPVFNVTWKHTTVDAYTEKGGDVALSVDEQSLDTITFGLGARLQTVVGESMYNRTSIFECRLLAKADAGDTEGTSKVALGSSATHEVKSNEMGAIGIEVGAGLTIPLGDEGSSIFMDASAEIRADYTDVNGTVGYRVNF